jgi:hypothetical protein
MPDPNDKRGLPREVVHLVAQMELEGREIGCGVSRDASGGGLLLLSDVDVPIGSKLTLKVFIPKQDEPRVLMASVIRCEPIPAAEKAIWGYRLGVAFETSAPDLQQIVQSLGKRSTRPPAA